jgi:DNA-binding MarR family transcriptional regulator
MLKQPRVAPDQSNYTEAGSAFIALIFEVFRTYNLINSDGDDLSREFGLSSARWRVLGSACQSPKTVSAIARERGFTRQSVQQIVKSLTHDGLIKLEENERHKRAKLVTATQAGQAALRQVNKKSIAWANHIAAASRPADIKTTLETLAKLRGRLEARRGS